MPVSWLSCQTQILPPILASIDLHQYIYAGAPLLCSGCQLLQGLNRINHHRHAGTCSTITVTFLDSAEQHIPQHQGSLLAYISVAHIDCGPLPGTAWQVRLQGSTCWQLTVASARCVQFVQSVRNSFSFTHLHVAVCTVGARARCPQSSGEFSHTKVAVTSAAGELQSRYPGNIEVSSPDDVFIILHGRRQNIAWHSQKLWLTATLQHMLAAYSLKYTLHLFVPVVLHIPLLKQLTLSSPCDQPPDLSWLHVNTSLPCRQCSPLLAFAGLHTRFQSTITTAAKLRAMNCHVAWHPQKLAAGNFRVERCR